MSTVIEKTRAAVDKARRAVMATLDVASVPDGHPIERRVNSAFIALEEALEKLPTSGRSAATLYEDGPVIRVIPNKDPRTWKTLEGSLAIEEVIPKSFRASRSAAMRSNIRIADKHRGRRAVTATQYLEMLESAIPVDSVLSISDEEQSYSMVGLADS